MPFKDDSFFPSQFHDDMSNMGICVFDHKGKFLYMNDSFLGIRNVNRSFYESLTCFDLLDNSLIDKCILDVVRQKQIPVSDVQTVMAPDGSVLCKQLVTVYPIFDESHTLKNYIAYYKRLDTFIQSGSTASEENIPFRIGDNPIIAESPSMRALYSKAKEVADTDATVLITGETGTGKDVLAKFIHASSKRKNKDLVVVDCAALPGSLMEAELFGYEKGSFTGASQSKSGLIESADGSTLFLDEINSLPLDLQGKLLRTLETKTVKRIGAVKTKPVNFRLIVATNMDLLQCVKDKNFRLDLYYRINVLTFHIPALRNRTEDIIPLARIYEKSFQEKYSRQRYFSPQLYSEMLAYSWPGNVRELKNFVERLVIMGPEDTLLSIANAPSSATELPPKAAAKENPPSIPTGLPIGSPADPSPAFHPAADPVPKKDPLPSARLFRGQNAAQEKAVILEALRINGNHRERTADYLNISRRTLQYKLKKYDLL